MAKQPRIQMSGKEARYILKQNSVNLAWLAEQIGISPQALNSRLNADIFSRQNMIEINQIMKQDIFGIGEKPTEVLAAGSIPILDLRLSAGFGNGLFDDDLKPMEYVRTKTRNKKKTNRTISFSIPDEAFPIIKHYMNVKTGKLDFKTKGTYDTFKNIVSRDIKRIAKKVGIEDWQKVCYYTARKSFVQHGFDLGISLEVLEYCIGQSMKDGRPIFNYLKVMRRHADNAIRTILDALKAGDPHEPPA